MGIKTFATTKIGVVVLIAVAIGTMVGALLVLGPFIAIPTFLLFGLALPIYAGEKRPRRLAIWGIVVLLIAGGATSVLETQSYRSPSAPTDSQTTAPYGNGAAVVQNAVVTPFLGSAGTNFTFKATIVPANLPYNTSAIAWVTLFVSTCPGATSTNSPYCTSGYPFFSLNHSFAVPTRNTTLVEFNLTLHSDNIWWWQLAAVARNASGGTPIWIYLYPQNGYSGASGPVTGDYLSTFGIVGSSIYQVVLLYEGLPFYFVLLVYAMFKARERRRKEAAAGGGPSGPLASSGTPSTPAAPQAPTGTAPVSTDKPPGKELACPKCQAVVYPGEKQCWKCGADLTVSSTAPLSSTPPTS